MPAFFTPLLIDFYKTIKESNCDFKVEIVFVSWGKDENSF